MEHKLGQLFADAPLVPGGWDAAISAFAAFTGAGRAHMVGFGSEQTLPFSRFVGMAELPVDQQVKVGAADPGRSWRLGAVASVLEVVGETQYARLRSRSASEAYNGLCETADIPYGMQTVLWNDGGAMVGLATFRGFREGPASVADQAKFAQVAPYARSAVRMQHAIESQGVALTLGALESMRGAAFLLDRKGQVAQMTPAAEAAVRQGLLKLEDKRLAARNPVDDAKLRMAVSEALRGRPLASERIWLTAADNDPERRFCEVHPLPLREWATLFRPHVLVTFHQTAPISIEHAETLRAALQLTRAEAEVALVMANGVARNEIAAARGTSPSTVAIQIKHILHKTGLRREAELVALVNRLLRR
ncbi:helix-turn-helix transcriptional regulator [Sphingomonas turrisvirgatae]|uniref:HTH luxR-type domain-containing protein n=1 Tax=Sphingomonas turrisvirgatae TaxID=1888892 RepID=A0A1E3LTP1_9SPHN|nr:helix-turn-helix transcriptional regulator [Sphingomonas turrisvirgatae]ODP37151.1 hypothetical protein BFL28_02635 [Sphingomonas turrisvirgatae]